MYVVVCIDTVYSYLIVKVNVSSGEEDEEEIFKMRAKLYRYDPGDGTEDNEVKFLMEYDRIKPET